MYKKALMATRLVLDSVDFLHYQKELADKTAKCRKSANNYIKSFLGVCPNNRFEIPSSNDNPLTIWFDVDTYDETLEKTEVAALFMDYKGNVMVELLTESVLGVMITNLLQLNDNDVISIAKLLDKYVTNLV